MAARDMLIGLGVGLGGMYYFDPSEGERRRSIDRDKLLGLWHQARETFEAAGRDLGHRAEGSIAESNWPPARRLVAGALGTALMANCSRNFNFLNGALGTLGFGLFVRAVTNTDLVQALGLGHEGRERQPREAARFPEPAEEPLASAEMAWESSIPPLG